MCHSRGEVPSAHFHTFHHIFPLQPPNGPLSPRAFSASFLLVEQSGGGGGGSTARKEKAQRFFSIFRKFRVGSSPPFHPFAL